MRSQENALKQDLKGLVIESPIGRELAEAFSNIRILSDWEREYERTEEKTSFLHSSCTAHEE